MKRTELRTFCDLCDGLRLPADIRCDRHHVDLCPTHMRTHFDRTRCCLVPADIAGPSHAWKERSVWNEGMPGRKDFLTIPELGERWKIARPTVYDRLRHCGIKVLDFAPRNGRCRKIVPMGEILKFESGQLRRL